MTKIDVICIGGAAIDIKYRALSLVVPGTSNPVESQRTFGGVARNVAENLMALKRRASLVSAVGDDENGRAIIAHLDQMGIDTRWVATSRAQRTATYAAVLQPDGSLALGLADMAIFETIGPSVMAALPEAFSEVLWVFADCNLPAVSLQAVIETSHARRVPLAIDAVSTTKARRLPVSLQGISLLFLNVDEARAILAGETKAGGSPETLAQALVDRGAERVVLTCGGDGSVIADAAGPSRIAPIAANVVDATGAGDALIAATIAGLMSGATFIEAARLGAAAASITIESSASVSPDLSLERLKSMLSRSLPTAFE